MYNLELINASIAGILQLAHTFQPAYNMQHAHVVVIEQVRLGASYQLDNFGFRGEQWRAMFSTDVGTYVGAAATPEVAICLAFLQANDVNINTFTVEGGDA